MQKLITDKCWDVYNLYHFAMSQKLPLNNFAWIEGTFQFNEDFIKSYNEESDEYFLEFDVQYPENLYDLRNGLPFLSERMKIEKVEKLVAKLHDKTNYVIHTRNLEQALNHGLVLNKFHRIINFKQKAWLKSHIDINTDLRKKGKNDFGRK